MLKGDNNNVLSFNNELSFLDLANGKPFIILLNNDYEPINLFIHDKSISPFTELYLLQLIDNLYSN